MLAPHCFANRDPMAWHPFQRPHSTGDLSPPFVELQPRQGPGPPDLRVARASGALPSGRWGGGHIAGQSVHPRQGHGTAPEHWVTAVSLSLGDECRRG